LIFTVWFGNNDDFKSPYTKKIALSFKNPTPIPDTFEAPLSTSQWNAIRKLGGDVTNANLYLYVQSQDGLGRRQATDPAPFYLNP